MQSRPHSSPCAPALGLIATPCMPVRSSSQKASSLITCERALHRLLRLQRVDVGKARQPRDLLVEARIVLHRARAEREQAEVDRVILPRQAGVVAHGFRLAEARQVDRPRCARDRRGATRGACGTSAKSTPVCSRAADLEQQRLLEHQRAVAGDGLRLALLVGGRGRPPARRIDGHCTTSFSAASRASMSSSVTVSVTATTRPFCSASTPG